jgi:nucleoid-associated protein YgaU
MEAAMTRVLVGLLGAAALLLPDSTGSGVDRTAAAVAAAGLLALGGWALLATVALLAARLPDTAGAQGRRAARRLLPAALHGLLGLAAVGLLPPGAVADTPDPPIRIDRIPIVASTSDMPAEVGAATPRPPAFSAGERPRRSAVHVVAPGDTLWSIAAADLPPASSDTAIDRRWRQWWQHNRAVVGPDPNMIHVGMRLTAPPPTS